MGTPTTHRTAPVTVRKAVADARTMSVSAVLTFPTIDLAGDYVQPAGLDFASHRADPWVDLEHTGHRVGWARKSLSRPGGEYGVTFRDLDIDGTTHRLPVGTTWFDPSDRVQAQTFALVERDALPGVSLEFRPVPGFCKSLGRSPLERRDAYEFLRADVVRWTHCATPVNAGALTVTKSLAAADPLLSVLSSGRVGSEPLHPVILKSLSQYAPPKRSAVVGGFDPQPVRKAMDETATAYDETNPEAAAPEPTEDAGPPNNGVDAKYKLAQDLMDAVAAYQSAMNSSDSPELHKLAAKFAAKISAVAEEVKGTADKHDAKLEAMKGGADEPAESEGDDEAEVDMDADEDGVLKAVRPVYRKSLKVHKAKRFSKNDLAAAELTELKKAFKALTKKVAQL